MIHSVHEKVKSHSDKNTLKSKDTLDLSWTNSVHIPTCGVLGGCAVQPRGQEAGAGRVEAGGAGGPVHLQ